MYTYDIFNKGISKFVYIYMYVHVYVYMYMCVVYSAVGVGLPTGRLRANFGSGVRREAFGLSSLRPKIVVEKDYGDISQRMWYLNHRNLIYVS